MRACQLPILALAAACSGAPKSEDTTEPLVRDSGADTVVVDTVPEATGCYDVPMAVLPGVGDLAWAPVADGDVVAITRGEQGGLGWHLSTAIRVEHTHPEVIVMPTLTVVATGEMISGLQGTYDANIVYTALVPTGECAGDRWEARALIDDVVPAEGGGIGFEEICALEGKEVRVDWTVTDLQDGRTGTASVTVVLTMDPRDVETCAALP